jgi:hypothetical protein
MILWAYYPEQGAPKIGKYLAPGPKLRPTVVLKIYDDGDLLVACGTSNTGATYPWDYVIGPLDGASFARTGLDCETRFKFNRMAVLPYTQVYFVGQGGNPNCFIGNADAVVTKGLMKAYQAWIAEVQRQKGKAKQR